MNIMKTRIILSILFAVSMNQFVIGQAKVSNKSMSGETSKSKSASKIYERGNKKITITTIASLNSANDEFYISAYKDGYVYSVLKSGKTPEASNDASFYFVQSAKGRFGKPQKFDLNTPIGLIPVAVSFDKNNSKMFVTCTTSGKNQRYNIYEASLVGKKWSNWTEIAVSKKMKSAGFPVVDSTGTKIYFSAIPIRGSRGYAIYSVTKTKSGWQDAKNIGEDINSDGNDMYPTLFNSHLFFSSNEKVGEGKYDIIFTDLNDNSFSCYNPGYPINSNSDEQMFILNADNTSGLLVRKNDSKAGFDIYQMKVDAAFISK